MKKSLRRMLALMMCLAMVVSCVPMMSTAAETTTEQPLLAFVPLDNRPVCVDRVVYAAEAAGFDIELPALDLYRTYLDDQGVNANGTQHGDGTAIAAWLMQMEAAGCNHYIIHLDQMFSGGLVGSRFPDSQSITKAETDIIDNCLIPLTNNAENHVYFVDTVMRLASTGSYKGYNQGEYGSFREYAAQSRYVMDQSGFATTNYNDSVGQLDKIVSYYQTGVNGEKLSFYTGTATAWNAPLTQAQINEYHAFRRRKLDLINLMMQFGNRNAVYVIGVDDASPKNTIQTSEIAFIRARMTALGYDYSLSADTDSSGLMALARCVNDYYNAKPTVQVRYFGNKIDVAADDYDIGTLRENISEHIRTLNATEVSSNGDIEVLVLTKADTTVRDTGVEDKTYTANIKALVARANTNIAAGKPTIIIEASTEGNYLSSWVKGFTNLQDELLENVEISKLMGYSNWNTVGNSIGIALGTGVSRYTYLKYADQVSTESNISFLKSITYTFIKDITYNARNKHQNFTWTFQYWITNKAGTASDGANGWNNGNFYKEMMAYDGGTYKEDWELNAGEHYVNNELTWCMLRGNDPTVYNGCGQQVLDAIMAGEIYTSFKGLTETAAVGNVTVDNFRCPWYRQFEITFDIFPTLDFFTNDASFLYKVATQQNASNVASQVAAQYAASSVSILDLNGAAATGYVGTGFTVKMTVNGAVSSYQVVITGDTNGDGDRTTSDVRAVMMNVVEAATFSDAQVKAADLNNSATITSTDARQLLQSLLV